MDIAFGNKDAEAYLNKWGLEFIPCIVCGKPLPGLVAMKKINYEIKELVYKNGWRHAKCPILTWFFRKFPLLPLNWKPSKAPRILHHIYP